MDRFEFSNAARMSAAGEGLTEPHYNLRTFPCADADKSGQYFYERTPFGVLFLFGETGWTDLKI
jgi:hypothetical protein